MPSTFNSSTAAPIQKLLAVIGKFIGQDLALASSAGSRVQLDVPDGKRLNVRVDPTDTPSGLSLNMHAKDPQTMVVPNKAQATLAAGVNAAVALPNAVGDLLAVSQVTAGGAAADHFSVVRVDANTVKVQAHDAAGALVAGNTSVVAAYNLQTLFDWL